MGSFSHSMSVICFNKCKRRKKSEIILLPPPPNKINPSKLFLKKRFLLSYHGFNVCRWFWFHLKKTTAKQLWVSIKLELHEGSFTCSVRTKSHSLSLLDTFHLQLEPKFLCRRRSVRTKRSRNASKDSRSVMTELPPEEKMKCRKKKKKEEASCWGRGA